jgi:hypothetical protein
MISYEWTNQFRFLVLFFRGEDREKTSEHLKSSSSEESVRKRRPSGNISINSTLSICTQNSNTLSNITLGSEISPAPTSAAQTTPSAVCTTDVGHHQQHPPKTESILVKASEQLNNKAYIEPDSALYDTVDNVIKQQQSLVTITAPIATKNNNHKQDQKYNYHDEPHSFENSMDYRVVEDAANMSHFTFEVLETTVWLTSLSFFLLVCLSFPFLLMFEAVNLLPERGQLLVVVTSIFFFFF